jgi:heme/copper-type cytochrome/quinol oxidase subunit 4
MSSAEKQRGGLGTEIVVYLCLLAISGLQIILAYNGDGKGLFVRLLVVASIQAVLAVLFFMHLRAERRSLIVFVAIFTLFVLAALNYGWPDSFRLLVFRLAK